LYDPESPFIYVDLGTNAMMRQEFFEAISWYDKALSLDRRCSESHLLKAQCYYAIGFFKEAKEEMVSYLKSNPGDPNALDLLSKMDG
jgi:tetratricopeptide (TPR) repeat protein